MTALGAPPFVRWRRLGLEVIHCPRALSFGARHPDRCRARTRRARTWTKPTRETFATFVEEWRRVYLPSRNLKRSTLVDYANTLDRHALPYFGSMALDAIGPEHLDKYIGAKLADGYRQRR